MLPENCYFCHLFKVLSLQACKCTGRMVQSDDDCKLLLLSPFKVLSLQACMCTRRMAQSDVA
jgi:hypothetical protein